MAAEVAEEVFGSFTSQKKAISEDLNRDISDNFLSNDGSNACMYLCTKIADELFKTSEVNSPDCKVSMIKKIAEETIRSLPKVINPLRKISEYADADEALKTMNDHKIISTKYVTKELLQKQSAKSLTEKKGQLRSALLALETSKNAEGKAFAIYTCNPFAILVGVLNSAFAVIDTHKVREDVGGNQAGLLGHFPFECSNKEKVIDGLVDWISPRMKGSIDDYSTQQHSLLMMEVENANTYVGAQEFVISDTEDADLLNASMEVERDPQCHISESFTEMEHSHIKPEDVKTENSKSAVGEDESAPWVSPGMMTPPPKATEII